MIELQGASRFEEYFLREAMGKLPIDRLEKANLRLWVDADNIILFEGDEKLAEFVRPFRLGMMMDVLQKNYHQKITNKAKDIVSLGVLTLDAQRFLLRHTEQGNEIYLTEKETSLLLHLCRAHHSVARDVLLNEIWGYGVEIETHTLETHIYRLRQKISQNFGIKEFIIADKKGYFLQLT